MIGPGRTQLKILAKRQSYWNNYGLAPFGENEILNAAIYYRLLIPPGEDRWVRFERSPEEILKVHKVDNIIQYPPNPKEGWSHDNNLGLRSLVFQFGIVEPKHTAATLAQRIAFKFFNFPGLWQFLGIITCLRGYETRWDGERVPRTSGLRLLWLRCQINRSVRWQRFYQMLLEQFHPSLCFEGVFQDYHNDENHPIVKLAERADI
jgi:hypothetical protein